MSSKKVLPKGRRYTEQRGTRPTLETLERVAGAVGPELAVVVGTRLIENRSIAKMVRSGHAIVRKAS